MSNGVDCAAIMDSIMAGGDGAATPFPLAGLRLEMPVGYLFDSWMMRLPPALMRLSRGSVRLVQPSAKSSLDILEELRPANNPKSIVAAEAFALHQKRLQSNAQGCMILLWHLASKVVAIFWRQSISNNLRYVGRQ